MYLTQEFIQASIPDKEGSSSVPNSVLLRMFGQKVPSSPTGSKEAFEVMVNAQITDNTIFTLLSERRLGPRLFGIFPGGRLEEFIESEPLVDYRVCHSSHIAPIAQIMANIHQLEVPVRKDGRNFLIDTMSKWAESISMVNTAGLVTFPFPNNFLLLSLLVTHFKSLQFRQSNNHFLRKWLCVLLFLQ